jgi:DNA-directed RNA polymerase subunit alpha
VLLSSIEGSRHQLDQDRGRQPRVPVIDGVVEDVTDIVLNLKKILIVSQKRETVTLQIKVNRKGCRHRRRHSGRRQYQDRQPRPGHLHARPQADLRGRDRNQDRPRLLSGREQQEGRAGHRRHPIDSLFSPVRLVKYAVENTRVGQITDYDKLILEIWTDGRITPDDALKQSASILKHHLDVFDRVSEEAYEFENQQSEVSEEQNKLRKLLNMSVNEIELSVRAANCLNNANITTVGELAMKTEQEMLKYRNFGKKSLNEIKEKLEALGLSLGMKFDERLLDTKKEA